ncbi:MAG: hypothetical protein PHX38_03410 [Sulfuricella sp.]|nr:hypothetical protein [Sulfuricella sp.]
MRYAPDLPPPVAPAAETDLPGPLFAVQPPRRIEPRTLVPLVTQRFNPKAKKPDEPNREAAPPQSPQIEQRVRPDRREMCRRVARAEPFLDTRSRVERRKKARRGDDVATTLDEEG